MLCAKSLHPVQSHTHKHTHMFSATFQVSMVIINMVIIKNVRTLVGGIRIKHVFACISREDIEELGQRELRLATRNPLGWPPILVVCPTLLVGL